MRAEPGVGLADGVDEGLDLVADLFERFTGQVPEVVFDGAVVGGGAGVGDDVEAPAGAAAWAADDDAGQNGVEPGWEQRVVSEGGPLPFQVLQGGDDAQGFLDGVDAGIGGTATGVDAH